MSLDVFAAAVVGAFVLGFSAGLFLFRVKSRWCPDCGAWTHATGPVRANGVGRQR
jgi:hypothetical protein